jgi:hypothetical protein
MLRKLGLSALAIATVAIGTAASAQDPIGMTAEQAIEIARQEGLVEVEEVDRDDRAWEIEGTDISGREIEVDIDIRTGRVINVERD